MILVYIRFACRWDWSVSPSRPPLAGIAAEPITKPGAMTPTTAPAVDQGRPIVKDVYRNHFLIGIAGDFPGNYSEAERSLARTHFNALTAENCIIAAIFSSSASIFR
jgi:hypothetical protein